MKLTRSLTFTFVTAVLAAAPAAAQTVDFVFVAPTATINTHFPGAPALTPVAPGWTASWATLPPGYKGVLITAANLATFTAQAPPRIRHLYTQLQPGTTLRNRLNQVLTVSGNLADIRYFLVDDSTNIDAGDGILGSSPKDGHRYVWPAANSLPVPGGNRHQGIVGMGEVWGEFFCTSPRIPGGVLAWEAVALHEGSHTQWVGEFSRWGVLNQSWIVYGQGGHYNEEIMGDQEAPHNEGIGTFFGYMHNPAEWTAMVTNFFSNADYRYFVDAQSVPAGWEALYRVPSRRSGTVGRAPNTINVWDYRWHDVPGKYILFSESTPIAFYMSFWQHANGNRDEALRQIIAYAQDAWDDRHKRFLTYTANTLALQTETVAGWASGRAAAAAGTATSSMFPYALIDILTHFGMSDAEYQQEIRRHNSRPPLSRASTEYFNAHRAAVRTRVQPMLTGPTIRFEDAVREAATYFRQASTILAALPADGDTRTAGR